MNNKQISRYLDHAVLRPEMTVAEVVDAIKLGIEYKVRTVCVRPCDIRLAVGMCKGTKTDVSCVLGFPHGNVPAGIKAEEAKLYISQGVHEVDMVANYGYIRSGEWDLLEKDIEAVCSITKSAGIILKVILETGVLNLDEVSKATEVAIKAKADFVKTSTGFNGGGATEEAVRVMLDTAGGRIMVKASGGIRDAQRAEIFLKMGCERLGVNYIATPAICEGSTNDVKNEGY